MAEGRRRFTDTLIAEALAQIEAWRYEPPVLIRSAFEGWKRARADLAAASGANLPPLPPRPPAPRRRSRKGRKR